MLRAEEEACCPNRLALSTLPTVQTLAVREQPARPKHLVELAVVVAARPPADLRVLHTHRATNLSALHTHLAKSQVLPEASHPHTTRALL